MRVLSRLIASLSFSAFALAGCASVTALQTPRAVEAAFPTTTVDPAARAALAPTGSLRVAVYPGAPTSLVRHASTGLNVGVTHDLGHALARELGVPVKVMQFDRPAQITDAIKAGEADLTFTNATEARMRDTDFTPTLLRLELGYLVPAGSALRNAIEVDSVGKRIGVVQGSTTQGALPRILKAATLVPVSSLAEAQARLKAGQLDAFATNKGILFELADQVPGARVLDGRWGLENFALGVPKGRVAGAATLRAFGERMRDSGELARMAERAGLRGVARD